MNYSLTYIGIIVSLVSIVVERLGLNIAPGDIETTLLTITAIVGGIIAFIGRYRKGDIKLLGFRKPKVAENN